MKNFKCEDVINKIQWNQLRIAIRDDLPENALAGAFGDTIVLSKKLIQMVKNGLISKLSFLFIFLHEIAHIAQQALLSKKLLNADVAEFIRLHRIFLEKNANEIARRLICEGVWRKVVALIDFNTCECAKPYAYDSLSVQWWMVDGILSEAYMAEDPQEGGKADDIKNEVKIAIANVKNDDEIKKELEKVKKDEDIILFEDAEKFSNQIFDMQSAAIEEGIHETYARDALAEFEKNCNGHIDANSKAQNIKLKFNNADNGGRYYLIEKNGEVIHKINRESFVEGAQWNDRWHYCNARFALKFKVVSKDCTLKDAFIYSSHLKRMQFLHSMDCSNGSKLFNYKKIKRWAEFCIDVFNNIEVPIIKAPASNNEVQKNKHEASVNDIKTSTTENESTAKDVETIKEELKKKVMQAVRQAKNSASVSNTVAQVVCNLYGEKDLLVKVHNALKDRYTNYLDIYDAIKPIVVKYDKEASSEETKSSVSSKKNTEINTEIQKALGKGGFSNDITNYVASTVVKNIGAKNYKQQIYRTIISKYGQGNGLNIYNHIKKLL